MSKDPPEITLINRSYRSSSSTHDEYWQDYEVMPDRFSNAGHVLNKTFCRPVQTRYVQIIKLQREEGQI